MEPVFPRFQGFWNCAALSTEEHSLLDDQFLWANIGRPCDNLIWRAETGEMSCDLANTEICCLALFGWYMRGDLDFFVEVSQLEI